MADNINFNDFDITVEIYDSVIAKWVLTDYAETDPSKTSYLRNRDLIQPKLVAGENVIIDPNTNEISAQIRLDQMEQFISRDAKNELRLGSDQLLYVGFSGLLRNGGDVATRQDLPDMSDPFIAHMIKDENLIVFSYMDENLGLVWLPLSFYVDMNLYVSKTELTEELENYVLESTTSVDPTANSIPVRDASGRVKSAAGVSGSDVTTMEQFSAEVTAREGVAADLASEVSRAQGEEGALRTALSNEVTERTEADSALSTRIASEETRAKGVEAGLDTRTKALEAVVPPQATPSNQLADKNFVNSSIVNMAAQFVTPSASDENTQWASFAALQAGPWFWNGASYTPTKNDYAIYLNTDNSVWRAHYTGVEWQAQYEVNDTPFTSDQLAAINSGITATIVNSVIPNKLDKVSGASSYAQLYGKGADGSQTMYNVVSGLSLGGSIPLRTADGAIFTGTPTDPAHAATKAYADTKADKQDVAALTSGFAFPLWNTQGVITGRNAAAVVSATHSVNGASIQVYSQSATAVTLFAPITVGTAGQLLISSGSGAPVWGIPTPASIGCAPTNHAVAANTYGQGSDANFGHVKLSAATNATSGAADGVAATPSAVKAVNDALAQEVTNRGTAVSGALADAKAYTDTKVTEALTATPLASGALTFDPAVLSAVTGEALGHQQLLVNFTPVADITPDSTPFTVFSNADASILPTLSKRFGQIWDYSKVEQVGFCVFDQDGDLTINAVATLFAGTSYTLLV